MHRIALTLALTLGAVSASAQTLVLSDFSDFVPDQFSQSFDGVGWSPDTALSGPTAFTIGDIGNGSPTASVGNRFVSYFETPQDWSQFTTLTLNGSTTLSDSNYALYFYLEDLNFGYGAATALPLSGFADGFESVLLDFGGVDPTQITGWGFAVQEFDQPEFNFTFDQVTLSAMAIPESSTTVAMLAALAAAGALRWRRRTRA